MKSIKRGKIKKFRKINNISASTIDFKKLHSYVSNDDVDFLLQISREFHVTFEINSSYFERKFVQFYLYKNNGVFRSERHLFNRSKNELIEFKKSFYYLKQLIKEIKEKEEENNV